MLGVILPKKSNKSKKSYFSHWWHLLKHSPADEGYYQLNFPKIVAIGGGSGLSSLLRGLKNYTPNITAVVAVTDNGHSSGFIRKEFDTLPPGDIRKCICALSPEEDMLVNLLSYRFKKGRGLNGHSLGNLLMVALNDLEGRFDKAVIGLSEILKTVGSVLPVTLDKVNIIGHMQSGDIVEGEVQISQKGHIDPIVSISLSSKASIYPPVKDAIKNADIIIIGPGSLYTSIMPPLVVSGLSKALKCSSAPIYYICNTSTERGETEGYDVAAHLKALLRVIKRIDYCLVNNMKAKIPKMPEGEIGSISLLRTSEKEIFGTKIISADMINGRNPLCHDSELLAKAILDAYNE